MSEILGRLGDGWRIRTSELAETMSRSIYMRLALIKLPRVGSLPPLHKGWLIQWLSEKPCCVDCAHHPCVRTSVRSSWEKEVINREMGFSQFSHFDWNEFIQIYFCVCRFALNGTRPLGGCTTHAALLNTVRAVARRLHVILDEQVLQQGMET